MYTNPRKDEMHFLRAADLIPQRRHYIRRKIGLKSGSLYLTLQVHIGKSSTKHTQYIHIPPFFLENLCNNYLLSSRNFQNFRKKNNEYKNLFSFFFLKKVVARTVVRLWLKQINHQ
jgi:hypothetical protein